MHQKLTESQEQYLTKYHGKPHCDNVKNCLEEYGRSFDREVKFYNDWLVELQDKFFEPFKVIMVEYMPESVICSGDYEFTTPKDIALEKKRDKTFVVFNKSDNSITTKKYFNLVSLEYIDVKAVNYTAPYFRKIKVDQYFDSRCNGDCIFENRKHSRFVYVDPRRYDDALKQIKLMPTVCGITNSITNFMLNKGLKELNGHWVKTTIG